MSPIAVTPGDGIDPVAVGAGPRMPATRVLP